uniref:Exportin-7-A-like n=2 Tax=Hirondellea gigas TaxID=1518452 RepID=A0A6A7FXJ8_9CRUS
MADEQDVIKLEQLCKQLHEANNGQQRQEAEKALVEFQSGVGGADTLSRCQMLLERAHSSYSQYLAATTLTKMVSRNPCSLTLQQRIHIRNYVLNYLGTRPKLMHYVNQGLVELFARITKLGWYDSVDKNKWAFRDVLTDVSQFLKGPIEHRIIGIELLARLTAEMNQISESDANKSLAKHRKIASSYRDQHLLVIFQLACTHLRSETYESVDFTEQNKHSLILQLLQLALNCLTFDFIGTAIDDSGDDFCTVQIPTSWRLAFLDLSTVQLFFDMYAKLPSSLASMCISVLVQIASLRRTFFTNDERLKFLSRLVNGVKSILMNPQSLSEPSNYHEFCRLLLRLKSNYQLGELVTVTHYAAALELIAKFTVDSLSTWQFAPNSVHYLLSLWQRMVGSVPYMKGVTEPHLLDLYTPEVFRAYVVSRLESVSVVLRERCDDPLEDLTVVNQQLDQLSTIGRCKYSKTCPMLLQLFEQTAQRYQDLISAKPSSQGHPQAIQEMKILQGQLTWLVYIIGSVLGGRMVFNTTEEHDAMDGELACRVLQLMNLTDSCLLRGDGCERLEIATISFFDQFRKIYVGDQTHKFSRLYMRLAEILGLNDETMVLAVFVRKIIINLKYWGHSELLLNHTLKLLSELSNGYNSVRKLVKLDEMQFMLNNHTSEHFAFLSNVVSVKEMRSRTLFYTSMGRLLILELGEDEDKFDQFMQPLTNAFDNLGGLLSQGVTPMIQAEEAKKTLIGLARDIRGLANAFTTKLSYMMFFDWIYPTYSGIFIRGLEIWSHDPEVTTPILKLYAELVQNKSQRLQFDVASPNGILLFREASKVIVTYGSRLLARGNNIPKEQIYPLRLKGISVCFSMLKAALCGNYVNFGVFLLYGDEALDSALHTFVKLLLSIPQEDLMVYPKLSQTYFVLLECLAQDHMNFLATLEPNVFLYILSSISEGLSAIDTSVCSGCCATLDHIVTHLFKQLNNKGSKKAALGSVDVENDSLVKVMKHQPQILHQMLSTVLNIIMFEDCRNQWSMSRPLLPLILLNNEYFGQLRQQIISQQAADKQTMMAHFFENLMEGIQPHLQSKNRDKFTQNLSVFRREINDSFKDAVVSLVSNNSEMMTT